MISYQEKQKIKQLEKRKGGYFYLKIDSDIINEFSRKRATRMICTIDNAVYYRCGLTVFLEQDLDSKANYNKLTDGKKRSLIYSFNKLKDIDKQVKIIIEFLSKEKLKMK